MCGYLIINCQRSSSRLEVKVKGKPKPEGKWYKQGVEIVSSQEFLIEEFEDGTSVLTIAETFPDDTGEIVFEAHNPLGVSTTTAYLSVEGNIFFRAGISPRISLICLSQVVYSFVLRSEKLHRCLLPI